MAQVEDLTKAFMLARSHSPTERVMVEQYLEGPQVSTRSIVVNGRCFTPGFSDRNYEYLDRYAPFFIENGGDMPSHLPSDIQDKVKAVVAKTAAAALGVTNGTVRGDIVVHKGEPYVIRLSPALLRRLLLHPRNSAEHRRRFHRRSDQGRARRTGFAGKNSNRSSRRARHPALRLPWSPGHVLSISGADEARQIPGITEVVVTAKPGDIIPPAGDKRSTLRVAMVLATGATREARTRCSTGERRHRLPENQNGMNAPFRQYETQRRHALRCNSTRSSI